MQSLSEQKDMLLSEMSHRVANSLQIIASILLLKARSVQSEETRGHLEDAHRRVMSVASLQQHLQATGKGEEVEIGSYLSMLCDTLTGSMVREKDSVVLKVIAGVGTATSEQAVSIGLIVTELVINALKHAFPVTMKSGAISVSYEVKGNDWKLSVSDNGVGMPKKLDKEKAGLGTTLVKALAHQLQAQVETVTSDKGTTVSITHATF